MQRYRGDAQLCQQQRKQVAAAAGRAENYRAADTELLQGLQHVHQVQLPHLDKIYHVMNLKMTKFLFMNFLDQITLLVTLNWGCGV